MIAIQDIQTKYSPEMALAIMVCRVYLGTASPDEIALQLSTNNTDWQKFKEIIGAHQVRPLIYKVLSAHPDKVDAAYLDSLRNTCLRITTGNMQKMEEMVRIHTLLTEHGVKNIAYKGIVLSTLLFGDFISRETADIDLLLQPGDFAKARDVMTADGYESKYYDPAFEDQFLRTSHELLFKKTTPAYTFKIELHWAATNSMMNIPLTNAVVFNNTETTELRNRQVTTLSLHNHLLVLLVHHGVNDIWSILRHVLDISLLVHKHGSSIDWNALYADTIRYRIQQTTTVGLTLASELFGINVPAPFKPDVAGKTDVLNNLLTYPVLERSKLTMKTFRQQLLLRDSLADKIKLSGAYMATAITPNVRDMEAMPLARKWYFLYYIIKPFRILFKK